MRLDLLQQFHPFTSLCGTLYREAGYVTAWTCEARGEAARDGIGYVDEYDGNGPRLAGKSAGHGCSVTEDHVWPQIDQFFCERPDPIRISVTPAQFDSEIAAFRPPQL